MTHDNLLPAASSLVHKATTLYKACQTYSRRRDATARDGKTEARRPSPNDGGKKKKKIPQPPNLPLRPDPSNLPQIHQTQRRPQMIKSHFAVSSSRANSRLEKKRKKEENSLEATKRVTQGEGNDNETMLMGAGVLVELVMEGAGRYGRTKEQVKSFISSSRKHSRLSLGPVVVAVQCRTPGGVQPDKGSAGLVTVHQSQTWQSVRPKHPKAPKTSNFSLTAHTRTHIRRV